MFNALSCMLCSGFLGFHNEFGGAAPTFNFKDLMVLVAVTSFADVANRDIIFPKIPSCKKECTNEVPATRLINSQFTTCWSSAPRTAAQAFADRQAAAMEACIKANPAAPSCKMLAWQEKYLQSPAPDAEVAAAAPKRMSDHLGTSEYVY